MYIYIYIYVYYIHIFIYIYIIYIERFCIYIYNLSYAEDQGNTARVATSHSYDALSKIFVPRSVVYPQHHRIRMIT